MEKTLNIIERYTLLVLILLTPIVILPIFNNAFVLPKIIIITFGLAIILISKSIRSFARGTIRFSSGPFDFPVFLLAISYLVSALVITPNKMEAFFLPATATAFISGALIYFVINQGSEKDKGVIKTTILVSSVIVAIFSLFATSGVLASIESLPQFMQQSNFNTTGGSLPTFIFLLSIVPMSIGLLLSEKDMAIRALKGISLAIVVFGILVSVFNTFFDKSNPLNLPDFSTSWAIAVDTLKESPLLGIGPGNYLTAFNRFKPITYNQTNLWTLRFTTARNLYLTIITETGLLGLSAIILLIFIFIKVAQKSYKDIRLVGWGPVSSVNLFSLGLLLALLAIFPANIIVIMLLFTLLALSSKTKSTELLAVPQTQQDQNNVVARLPITVFTLPVIIAAVAFVGYTPRLISAEYKFKVATDAVVRNDGKAAYDTLIQAIQQSPFVDRYHASYAQVNLALANSLASQKNLTDQDRVTITRLIQQAIREGKATIALNPTRAGNWEVLASIYRTVIPLAEDADQFAIQTYKQVIALDPYNPNTRISLGGIYYSLGLFEDAAEIFELATIAKQDHANAHYNLAVALRESGKIDKAINEMSIVLSQVDRNSNDYEIAKQELEALQSQKAAAEATEQGESLTPPQPAEEPLLQPQIELPEEAEPPQPKASPTPTPVPSPTPTPPTSPTPLP